MSDFTQDYAVLDVPEVLLRLFHPRPELGLFNPPTSAQEIGQGHRLTVQHLRGRRGGLQHNGRGVGAGQNSR